ncbi:MAG: beta-ketoacyl synthase N-terminal-like domain-containing protein, partial [Deferribacterota bacterium]|nr:beta-ketoacyl synthase N-terminal-like domain-containing protein [Deferribacterota bacterium]
MRDVVVAGIGQTKYGMLWDYSLRDLAALAVIEALDSNAVDKIDSIYTGNFSAGTFVEQEHIGALVADYTGFVPLSSTRVENACASGAVAFRTAFNEIASGFSDVCLVLGIEKMSDVVTSEAVYSLSLAGDREYEGYQGVTFPALFALVAKSYMHEFNMPRRALSQVSVKNHENAYSNPKA